DADERRAQVQQVARLAVDVPDDEDRHGDRNRREETGDHLVAEVALYSPHGRPLDVETAAAPKENGLRAPEGSPRSPAPPATSRSPRAPRYAPRPRTPSAARTLPPASGSCRPARCRR